MFAMPSAFLISPPVPTQTQQTERQGNGMKLTPKGWRNGIKMTGNEREIRWEELCYALLFDEDIKSIQKVNFSESIRSDQDPEMWPESEPWGHQIQMSPPSWQWPVLVIAVLAHVMSLTKLNKLQQTQSPDVECHRERNFYRNRVSSHLN